VELRTLSHEELPVESEPHVSEVRHRVRVLAQKRGFDAFATAAVTTATSDRGTTIIEEITDGERVGLRIRFVDRGPGIADLPRVLAGGYSTARSLGLGLSGSRRLVDAFEIESEPNVGTKIEIIKWGRPF
jgi:serine/threonine-protein kinase RsbT